MRFFALLLLSLALFGFSNAQPTPGDDWAPIQWSPANQELAEVLDYGIDTAVPDAIAEGELADGEWNWKDVTSVGIQVIDEGTYFKYYVDIENESGDIAQFVMIVFLYSDGTTKKLLSFEVL